MLVLGLLTVHRWTYRWRLPVNIPKTEVICFTKKGHKDVNIKMNNKELKQVKEKRILGVVLDENLDYKSHIQLVAAKSKSALGKICIFTKESKGASMKVMCMLYKACVRPLMEYAYPVWSSNDKLAPLEQVQNLAFL